MSHLSQLKSFISRPELKSDPYWRSILTSDSRNIFPKHELAKIELAKNKMVKQRLMMQQLPHFLALQIYARKMKRLGQSAQEKDVRGEVEQLTQQFERCKNEAHSSDYQFQVIEAKQKIEYFCSQLSRPKIKPELRQLLQKNEKWRAYLESNASKAEPMQPVVKEIDRCELARVIQLDKVDDSLKIGTAGKILEERLKEEILQHRLKEMFQKGLDAKEVKTIDDPWRQEWEQVLGTLIQPVSYV